MVGLAKTSRRGTEGRWRAAADLTAHTGGFVAFLDRGVRAETSIRGFWSNVFGRGGISTKSR